MVFLQGNSSNGFELKAGSQVRGWGSRSAGYAAHRGHGCSVAQAAIKGRWPELNAVPNQVGPGPCFSHLFTQQPEASCQRGPWAQAAEFLGEAWHSGSDTSSMGNDDALCVHLLVLGDFLKTLYPCYPSPWRNALQKRKLVEHLPTCTQNGKIQSRHCKW